MSCSSQAVPCAKASFAVLFAHVPSSSVPLRGAGRTKTRPLWAGQREEGSCAPRRGRPPTEAEGSDQGQS